MPLATGEVFAGYTVVRLLGAGGVGEVYLVEHPRLPRRTALKVLPVELTAGREYHERFNREADVVANLWHPHIVAVHDRGEFAGQLWMSMDYMEGTDAARLLQDRRGRGLPPADVVRLVAAVADALDYAHERRLLHRDVKPSNILLSQSDTGRQRIMLADFGIARMVGQQLFAHTNPAVVISQHLTAPPPAIADRVPELSGLGPVFSKALAKKPQDRYGSYSEFADALARNLDSSSLDTGASDATLAAPKARRARPFSDRRRARWALLAVVLVGLLGAAVAVGLIVGNRHRGGTPPQPSPSTPTVPVVLIGADCATLGSAGVSESGQTAYCARLPATGDMMWSIYSGPVPAPSDTPGPGEQVYPPGIEEQVRVCVEQTKQSRSKCREDVRQGNLVGPS